MKGFATYGVLVIGFICVAFILGLAGPASVSSRSTEMVILGFGVVLFLPIIILALVHWWRRTKEGKQIIKKFMPVLLLGLLLLGLLLLGLLLGACSKVPAGHVGVVVNLYGSDKGVSEREAIALAAHLRRKAYSLEIRQHNGETDG